MHPKDNSLNLAAAASWVTAIKKKNVKYNNTMYLNTIRDMWQILSAAQHPGIISILLFIWISDNSENYII